MIEYQRLILADKVRNAALERALKRVITPGCTVVDVGSGTGFLSFLALKLGAGKCICIEREPEFHALAKEIAKANGIRNCTFLLSHSSEVRGITADVVISETLGNFAYEENIIETLRDARRFLRRGGTMMPQSITQFVAPVVTDHLWREVASWDRTGFGIDWSPARLRSLSNMYVKTLRPQDLLVFDKAGETWDSVDFTAPKNSSVRTGGARWRVERQTTVYGLCLWWSCTLCPGVSLSTSPFDAPTHWQQIFLPALQPLALSKGEELRCAVTSDSRPEVKINVQWALEHIDTAGKLREKQAMDMQRGI